MIIFSRLIESNLSKDLNMFEDSLFILLVSASNIYLYIFLVIMIWLAGFNKIKSNISNHYIQDLDVISKFNQSIIIIYNVLKIDIKFSYNF
jgi:ascorbate-specific PTS system EIIC-type component UlaA